MEMTPRPAHGKSHLTQWLIQCTQIDSGWLSSGVLVSVLRVRSDWPARGSKGRGTRRRFLRRRRARIWSRCLFLLLYTGFHANRTQFVWRLPQTPLGVGESDVHYEQKTVIFAHVNIEREIERDENAHFIKAKKMRPAVSHLCVCRREKRRDRRALCIPCASSLKRERMKCWLKTNANSFRASLSKQSPLHRSFVKQTPTCTPVKPLFRHATATKTSANSVEFVQNTMPKSSQKPNF
jgi:hypothetical protein